MKCWPQSDLTQRGIPRLGIKSFKRCLATSLALQIQQSHSIGQFVNPSIATNIYLNPPTPLSGVVQYRLFATTVWDGRGLGHIMMLLGIVMSTSQASRNCLFSMRISPLSNKRHVKLHTYQCSSATLPLACIIQTSCIDTQFFENLEAMSFLALDVFF